MKFVCLFSQTHLAQRLEVEKIFQISPENNMRDKGNRTKEKVG